MAKQSTSTAAAPRPLSPRQMLFVLEYIKDFNGTQAAIRAGYAEKSAAVRAFELLRDPRVKTAIAEAIAERNERIKMDADRLLLRLVEEADADIADIYDKDGGLKPVHDWPAIWRKGLVAGLEVEEMFERDEDGNRQHVGTLRKIKISDRVKRLELIGRHVNVQAWKDKVEADVSDPLKELYRQIAGQSLRPADNVKPSAPAQSAIRPNEDDDAP